MTLYWLVFLICSTWLPTFAQTERFTPAPTPPKYVFTPAPAPQVAALNAQIASLQSQNGVLSTQNGVLSARLLTMTPAPATLGQPFANTTGQLFGYHVQASDIAPGNPPFQNSISVAGARLYIDHAAAKGADFFEIDFIQNSPQFTLTLLNYYAAANQYNADHGWVGSQVGTTNALGVGKFSIYVKFDFSNTALETPAAMLGVLNQVLTNPANLTYKNPATGAVQPVWATYVGGGGRSWASLFAIFSPVNLALKAQGVNALCIYGGEDTNPDGSPSDGSLASLTAWATGCVKPIAGAVCQFPGGCPLGSASPIPGKETLAAAVHAAGLLWQASFNCNYSQMLSPNARYVEDFYGGEGPDAQLRSIFNVQKPDLGVSCMTWNDWIESYEETPPYLYTPPLPAWVGLPHSDNLTWLKDTTGLGKFLEYYIARLKTGQYPAIVSDRIFGSYVAQTPRCLENPTADPLGGLHVVSGENGSFPPSGQPFTVRVASFLASSGYLTLTCTPPPVPATHTNLVAWSADPNWLYDPTTPFDGSETGKTLQVTYGAGWTPGSYTVDRVQGVSGQDGFVTMVHLSGAAPSANSQRSGQGTLYAAAAALPALPPAPTTSTVFVPAGPSFRRLLAGQGVPTLTLTRQKATVLTVTGEAIVDTAALANANTTWIWAGN